MDGVLVGIMDVTLIRHAYFATEHRGKGLGGVLLEHLLQEAKGPILVGTWAAATWAILFYAKHGFQKVHLLRRTGCCAPIGPFLNGQVGLSVKQWDEASRRKFDHGFRDD